MPYVLQRTDGVFVARPGHRSSYTTKLQDARVFSTREHAEREQCPENEHIVPVDRLLPSER